MLTNKIKRVFVGAIAISLISTISLTGCASEEKPYQSTLGPVSHYVQEILDELEMIAQASQLKQDTDGITETFYINSEGREIQGKGDLSWTTVYNPETKTHTSRYPTNPTYREAGTGPLAVGMAMSALKDYKAGNPEPVEKDGIYTFDVAPEGDQVTVVYTKDGLVTGVLIEDSVDYPTFTNFYEVNFYNVTNPIADQILKTNE